MYHTKSIRSAMDEFLPKAILDATQVILSMVGSVVVAATVNPYFLIPVAVMSILFVLVRKVYLKTAKNIKRLEGMGKFIKKALKFINVYSVWFFNFDVFSFLQQSHRCSLTWVPL